MAHASTSANLSVSRLFDFSKHVVLVTGGATGLGEMAAQAFIQNGAYVLIASRKKSALEETAKRLNQLGPGKCDYIVADLKDKAGCLALCEEVKKKTDRLTVLLNNSGATWVRGDFFFSFPSTLSKDALLNFSDTYLQSSPGCTIRRLPRIRLGQTHGPQRQIHLLHHRRSTLPPHPLGHTPQPIPSNQHRLHGRHHDRRRHRRRRRRTRRSRHRNILLRTFQSGMYPSLQRPSE